MSGCTELIGLRYAPVGTAARLAQATSGLQSAHTSGASSLDLVNSRIGLSGAHVKSAIGDPSADHAFIDERFALNPVAPTLIGPIGLPSYGEV
jgi:hypothetical protein